MSLVASGAQLVHDELAIAHELCRLLGWHHRLPVFTEGRETIHTHVSNHRLDACHLQHLLDASQLSRGGVIWVLEEEICTSRYLEFGQLHRVLDLRNCFLLLDCKCGSPLWPIDVQVEGVDRGELCARRAQDDEYGVSLMMRLLTLRWTAGSDKSNPVLKSNESPLINWYL